MLATVKVTGSAPHKVVSECLFSKFLVHPLQPRACRRFVLQLADANSNDEENHMAMRKKRKTLKAAKK
jgi:hypothetical protein